jgi:nucleotide-binding universal stress UspA family protein
VSDPMVSAPTVGDPETPAPTSTRAGADVVVGVPLGGRAGAAVHWAAAEARDRGVALRLVQGLVVPRGGYPGRSFVGVDAEQGLFLLARQELREMRLVARRVAPDLPIVEDLVESDPVAVLRAQARVASLLVLGSDGFGRLGELALGRTTRGLAGEVAVPVVLVPHHCDARARERAEGHAPVVVGDDGSEGCRGALRFAALRAASRGVPLVVVRAGKDVRLLGEDVPELGSARPAGVRVVLAEERADRVLADQARDAELVVVGVGEHGRLRHRHPQTRPGLVRRATCPVAIVPPGAGGRSRPSR